MEKFCTKCSRIYEDGTAVCPECGLQLVDAGLKPGFVVAGFEILGELGRGSNGIVYRARQIKLDREVALKILPVGKDTEEGYVENFFREARAAAKLSHPSIVMAFDAGVSEEGIYFFAMELINGESLDFRVMRQGPPELKSALKIARDVAEGLEYAWRTQHLTHGDIKPANIILDPFGNAKIADLGLAKTAGEGYNGELMATPMFAAPEVCNFDFDRIGFKSDMYSYACTIYFMFAGTAPFDEDDTEKVMLCHINEEPMPLAERLPMFPHSISEFVDRMLSKNPDDRPENWQEVVDFMVSAQRQAVTLQPLKIIKPKPWWKRPVFWLGILATFLILAAVAAGILRHRFRAPDKPAPEPKQAATAAKPQPNDWESFRTRLAGLPPDSQLQELRKRLAAGTDGETAQATAKTMIQNLESELKKKQLEEDPLLKNFLELTKARKFEDLPYSNLQETLRLLQRLHSELLLRSEPADSELSTQVNDTVVQLRKLSAAGLAEAERNRMKIARDDLKSLPPSVLPEIKLPPSPAKRKNYLAILLSIKKDMPWNENNLNTIDTLLSAVPSSGLDETDADTINFIRQQLLKCNKLIPILADNKNLFINKPLPDAPADIKVVGIDRRDMTVGREVEAGAIMRSRIPWSSFSPTRIHELIHKWILTLDPKLLTPREWSDLAGWMFLNGEPELLTELLAKNGTVPESELKSWMKLRNDLLSAEAEQESYRLYEALNENLSNKDYRNALAQLAALTGQTSAHLPAAELKQLEKALRSCNVMIPPADLYRRAEAEFKDGRFAKALELACSVIERCGGPDFAQTPGPKAEAMRERIIADHIIAPTRPPDHRQENLTPPGTIAKWQTAMNTPLSKRPGFNASIRLAAMLDLGQWHHIFSLSEFGRAYPEIISRLPGDWRTSAFYDFGILCRHFGSFRGADEMLKLLLGNTARIPDQQTVLAMRYAISVRSYADALKTTQSLAENNNIHAYRCALAGLLMLMQSPNYSEHDFAREVQNIKKRFSHLRLSEDFKFLDWATAVYANTPKVFPNNLRRCREKEFLGRLGCDILARDLCLDRGNHAGIDPESLLTIDNTYNFDLWYRYALLRLLHDGPRLSAWRENLIRLYDDPAIAAIPSYPKIIMLECVYDILSQNIPAAVAGARFKPLLSTLPMASDGDRNFADILLGSIASDQAGRISVWNRIATALAGNTRQENGNPLRLPPGQRAAESLLWQERLLLRDINTLLKASGGITR